MQAAPRPGGHGLGRSQPGAPPGDRTRLDEATRRHYRARRYGLTEAQLDAMEAEQEGRCLICGAADRLVIDHCHATGKVRGPLTELRGRTNRHMITAGVEGVCPSGVWSRLGGSDYGR
ncbi:endonuclease domain-containing protein [Streptomyces sp. NPDC057729]|uniref:endonuclease domain-containing protein n=1 Tax=Streptomyces sp. NPDC057729 TaxID=3346230 RepID=UPI0036CECC44